MAQKKTQAAGGEAAAAQGKSHRAAGAARMTDAELGAECLRLAEAGESKRAIARALGVGRRKVDRLLRDLAEGRPLCTELPEVGDLDEHGRRWNGRWWVFHQDHPKTWRQGQSGNPAGSKKGRRLTDVLREVGERPATAEQAAQAARWLEVEVEGLVEIFPHGFTIQDFIGLRTMVEAASGNIELFREAFDRRDPKPRRVELTGAEGRPVAVAQVRGKMSDRDASDLYRALVDGAPAEPE